MDQNFYSKGYNDGYEFHSRLSLESGIAIIISEYQHLLDIMIDEKKQLDTFLKTYNNVDELLRSELKTDEFTDHISLIREFCRINPVARSMAEELRSYAKLRNVLIHSSAQDGEQAIAMPSKKTVEHYLAILATLKKPPLAIHVAVPGNQLFVASTDDNVLKVVKKMSNNVFTHVPIIKNGQMVGVFSENTLLSYLSDKGELLCTDDMKIYEFSDYIDLDGHAGEVFIFLSRDTPLKEVYREFDNAVKKQIRIGAIFITQSGKKTEKILGLITPWDVANIEQLL